jgi:hypothetical protein
VTLRSDTERSAMAETIRGKTNASGAKNLMCRSRNIQRLLLAPFRALQPFECLARIESDYLA